MKRYNDTTSLKLDILGEMPPPVKKDIPTYKGFQVFDNKTGSNLDIIPDPKVYEQMVKDASRHTYGSNLRCKSV